MKEKNTTRKNVTMKLDLSNWIEESSEKLGISQSAFIVMVLMEYKRKTCK